MDANNYAGSDFLKAGDLGNTTPTIQVVKVEEQDFGQGEKPKLVLHPSDPAIKPVVLNVTNTRACIAAWGADTNGWLNRTAMLSVRQTQMGPGLGVTPMVPPPAQGQPVPLAPTGYPPAVPQPAQTFPQRDYPQQPPVPGDYAAVKGGDVPFDDDIPFG